MAFAIRLYHCIFFFIRLLRNEDAPGSLDVRTRRKANSAIESLVCHWSVGDVTKHKQEKQKNKLYLYLIIIKVKSNNGNDNEL